MSDGDSRTMKSRRTEKAKRTILLSLVGALATSGLTALPAVADPVPSSIQTHAASLPPETVKSASALNSSNRQSLPAFKNWGIFNQQAPSHIRAVEAWKLNRGSRKVLVAVIDTGIDARHPDLRPNLWQGKDPATGAPIYGWNFVTNKPNPDDDHGHGTHVAGILGAITNPAQGTSGVSPEVSIMAVKYYSETNTGQVNLENTVKAIDFAVRNGARIINYSGGGPEFSEEEYLAIKRAEARGVLFIAAAGNERQDVDRIENYYYPAAYRLSNILSVSAVDIRNALIKSSNWGRAHVDVAAPGENIYSTLPGGRYGYMTGTSQATAFVTGLAALILARDPSLTPVQVKQLIVKTVDRLPTLSNKVIAGGRINAFAALTALEAAERGEPSPLNAPGLPRLVAKGPSQPESAKKQKLLSPAASQ